MTASAEYRAAFIGYDNHAAIEDDRAPGSGSPLSASRQSLTVIATADDEATAAEQTVAGEHR